jgi:antitoxin (DNA-binding transcriptional repressor) of toxin-antitoxin stability system
MKFVPSRELRLRTAEILKMLQDEDEIVVTLNGKPASIMIPANEDDLEQVMSMIKRIKAKNALRRMREKATENNITEYDIDEEIAKERTNK